MRKQASQAAIRPSSFSLVFVLIGAIQIVETSTLSRRGSVSLALDSLEQIERPRIA